MAMTFGPHLMKVIKHVRKKGAGGQTKIVKQAYYVKNPDPGDRYAHMSPDELQQTHAMMSGEPAAGQPEQPEPKPQKEPVFRIQVVAHDVPWKKKKTDSQSKAVIPDEVRARFDPENRHLRAVNPNDNVLSTIHVGATDPILWGVDERRVSDVLRTGFLDKLRVPGGQKGMMIADVKDPVAGSYQAFMWMDELREPDLGEVWGSFLSKRKQIPAFSRHAASYYEVAKACGFDDLVPPTVTRIDERGDLYHLLPQGLVERRDHFLEWVSSQTGMSEKDVRNRAGGPSAVTLKRGEWSTMMAQPWFFDVFSTSSNDHQKTEFAESFWQVIPPAVRIGFLRTAMIDFACWNMARMMTDILFSDDPKHPVILVGNELSVPCPRKLADEYVSSSYKSFGEAMEDVGAGKPLLLHDLFVRLSVRGSDAEIDDFEKMGHAMTDRMVQDRPHELVRSLLDKQVPPCHVAGVLARIWLAKTHSRDIAKDPFVALNLFAGLRYGQKMPEMEGVIKFVDDVMSKAMVSKFDFVKSMRSDKKDEDKEKDKDNGEG